MSPPVAVIQISLYVAVHPFPDTCTGIFIFSMRAVVMIITQPYFGHTIRPFSFSHGIIALKSYTELKQAFSLFNNTNHTVNKFFMEYLEINLKKTLFHIQILTGSYVGNQHYLHPGMCIYNKKHKKCKNHT